MQKKRKITKINEIYTRQKHILQIMKKYSDKQTPIPEHDPKYL